MNAKITITVPIEKVNYKVAEIMYDAERQIENLKDELHNIANHVHKNEQLLEQVEKIDRCRKDLMLLDATMEDCYNVLAGLIAYRTKANEGQKNDGSHTKEG
jgi:Mg2+ and Co2+ transporter CorA